MTETRSVILDRLRSSLARHDIPFPPERVEPLDIRTRMAVTAESGDMHHLVARFGQELDAVKGSHEVAESPTLARMAAIRQIQLWMEDEADSRKGPVLEPSQANSILSWVPDALPIPGLDEALADLELTVVSPESMSGEEVRASVRYIRYGITGVEAAFATTGSMLMAASASGTSRTASLLPYRHLALIPFRRLYPTIESWLAELRQQGTLIDFFRHNANLSMITGPSKSADIEGNLTLGVHGPKFIHAILFPD